MAETLGDFLSRKLNEADSDSVTETGAVNSEAAAEIYGSGAVNLDGRRILGDDTLSDLGDEEKEILREIQQCQRNWDHSHQMHQDIVDYLLWTADNSPSKQHEGYLDLYRTKDRKVLDELSENDKLLVARARKVERFLSQTFFVAEVFTGSPGKYVSLTDTIKGFKMILNGELDDLPEQSFYLVGNIDEAVEKAAAEKAKA